MKKYVLWQIIISMTIIQITCSGTVQQKESRKTDYQQDSIPQNASVNGKYYELLQVLHCPEDMKSYGSFNDWGYWKGRTWCRQQVCSGYWVWVEPNWYIWKYKR